MPTKAMLIGGPQDGAMIMCGGGVLPLRVYVGPKWLGDGYAAWARQPSINKPALYEYDGRANYRFARYQTKPTPVTPMEEPCGG